MNIKRAAGVLVVVMATLSVTACGHMSNRDRNTAIGAGVGAVGGAGPARWRRRLTLLCGSPSLYRDKMPDDP